jgi:hypothetical protein
VLHVTDALCRLRNSERGGVLVLTALWMPLAVLALSFVVDAGNWFEHRRHLQMQADAAAFAAALDLASPCSNVVVGDRVLSFGGRDYNPQVQNKQANVHTVVNSKTFFNQATPVDTTVDTNPPCTSLMVDVKLTETDLPWYFKLANVPFINAHARVGLFNVDTFTGSLPLAVPDVDPKKVIVEFIDESDPAKPVIATTPLTKGGEAGGLVQWSNGEAPLPVTVDSAHVGVRVIVSSTGSTTCGTPPVHCFDGGSADGLVHIRGWSAAGSAAQPDAPIARSVELEPGTCDDPYFNYVSAKCTVGVRAALDFGGIPPADVKVTVAGAKPAIQLTYDATSDTWTSPPDVEVAPAAGPQWIGLAWEVASGTIGGTACTAKAPCKGTFDNLQRTFSGTDARSGAIRSVDVSEDGVPGSNSLERCATCSHDLVVTIGLLPGLEVAKNINDPVVELRFSGGGSQSQGLDCDDNQAKWGNPNAPDAMPNFSLFDEELAWGCRPAYAPNSGTTCPANAAALWSTPNPPAWQCVATQTGQYVNKIGKGLNARILCPKPDRSLPACLDPSRPTECTHPNNWDQFTTGLPAGDPRIVQLFVTEYGVFNTSGSSTVPITRFATFYVTGWDGSGGGFPNPCQGNGDDPATDGTIVGHFIKYINTLGSSTGATQCNLNDATPCVPVMVV